ncbi:MAG: Flp pilus assembly protein CpaB [Desulfuromonadales bacterium C00003096]|nr:MAG: Flp pilus assembly protein CpaB [Desulfuromonadales bacterium C00003096]
MKKYGTVIALGLAILFGVVAVILVNKWLTGQSPKTVSVERSESMPLAEIVVVTTDLSTGTLLTAENLSLAKWPRTSVPKGTFENIADVAGRVNVSKLAAGNPIRGSELAAPGSGAGLVAVIKPGMRAMAIQVNEVTGVGGFILPNTFVDVIAIDGKKAKTAKTLLEKIEVLAIAQETFIEEGKAKVVRTVTLELTPEEARQLALQTNKAPIRLVLRNSLDEKEVKPVRKVVRRARRRVYTPPPPSFEVEIIRGEKAPEKYKFKGQP